MLVISRRDLFFSESWVLRLSLLVANPGGEDRTGGGLGHDPLRPRQNQLLSGLILNNLSSPEAQPDPPERWVLTLIDTNRLAGWLQREQVR